MLCLSLILAFTGCGQEQTNSRVINQTTGIKDVLESKIAEEGSSAEGISSEATDTSGQPGGGRQVGINDGAPVPETDTSGGFRMPECSTPGIDLDLTELTASMVYATVFDILVEPEYYTGKTIRMAGLFTLYDDPETGNRYYACIIRDATLCCAQGIEFQPSDEYIYPDDFPEVNEEICVTGVFTLYEENGQRYAALADAKIVNDPY